MLTHQFDLIVELERFFVANQALDAAGGSYFTHPKSTRWRLPGRRGFKGSEPLNSRDQGL